MVTQMNAVNETKTSILLVEDDMVSRRTESMLLIKSGFDVSSVSSGEDAISFLNHNTRIDLILMDVDLGDGISGIDTARFIEALLGIPVIFYTSHDELDLFLQTSGLRNFGYIPKTSTRGYLIDIISNAVFVNAYNKQNRY